MQRKLEQPIAVQLQKLIRERDQLVVEMEALSNKIAGLNLALRLISDQAPEPISAIRRKGSVSATIVNLLRESGGAGLKPRVAIELAGGRGIYLNRGSVYTLLNRMERAGIVVHEDDRYKLFEFARRIVSRGAA